MFYESLDYSCAQIYDFCVLSILEKGNIDNTRQLPVLSECGNEYIVVIIDCFLYFAIVTICASKDATAFSAACVPLHDMGMFGVPIISQPTHDGVDLFDR